MSELIKKYPWLLDLPSTFIACYWIIMPLVKYRELIKAIHLLPGTTASLTWFLIYAIGLAMILVMWVGQRRKYALLLIEEQKNIFHFRSLATVIFIMWTMPLIYGYMLPHNHNIWGDISWIIGFGLVFIQGLLEYARPVIPSDRTLVTPGSAAINSIRPGDSFYYREEIISRMGLDDAVFGVMLGLSIRHWYGVIGTAIWLIPLIKSGARMTLAITDEHLIVRHGFRKLSIPIRSIRQCDVTDLNPEDDSIKPEVKASAFKGMRIYVTSEKTGPCLIVKTLDGKTYLLGAKDPKTACRLITIAIAA